MLLHSGVASSDLPDLENTNFGSACVLKAIIPTFQEKVERVNSSLCRQTKIGSPISEQGPNSRRSRVPIPDATETLFTRHETGGTENQGDLCSLGQSHSVLVARVHAVLLGQSTFGFRVLRSFHIILLK